MLKTVITPTPNDFHKEFRMSRGRFDPKDFGIDMDREAFTDCMVDDFNDIYKGYWTIDELLLHPSEAVRFCEDVRRKHGYYDLPEDIILRSILTRRKAP